MFTVVESAPVRVNANSSAIDAWFAATQNCVDDENEFAMGSVALEYYRRLCFCLDANLAWLQQFLPPQLKDCLQSEQGAWLVLRKHRFATLNVLYGLLSGGTVPFDREALLLEQSNF